MNVGQRIYNRRKELGLSADEVAACLKKDRSTIYRYESNDIEKLPTSILEPLAKVLQTTPAYLMGWTDNATTEKKKTPIDNNIKKYFKLNSIGKNKVGTYIDDLLCNPQYMAEDYTYEIAAYGIDDTPMDEWRPPKTETTAD